MVTDAALLLLGVLLTAGRCVFAPVGITVTTMVTAIGVVFLVDILEELVGEVRDAMQGGQL